MIDFSKLLYETPEERDERVAHHERERAAAKIREDIRRRQEWSRQTLRVTILHDPDIRSTIAGEQVVHLRCESVDVPDFAAVYWIPSYYPNAARAMLDILHAGRQVELRGYWKTRQWSDARGAQHSAREFHAQFITQTSS